MPVAHTPSILGQGFNNTLTISSALLALLGRVTARRYTPPFVRTGLNLSSALDNLSSILRVEVDCCIVLAPAATNILGWLMHLYHRNLREAMMRR